LVGRSSLWFGIPIFCHRNRVDRLAHLTCMSSVRQESHLCAKSIVGFADHAAGVELRRQMSTAYTKVSCMLKVIFLCRSRPWCGACPLTALTPKVNHTLKVAFVRRSRLWYGARTPQRSRPHRPTRPSRSGTPAPSPSSTPSPVRF